MLSRQTADTSAWTADLWADSRHFTAAHVPLSGLTRDSIKPISVPKPQAQSTGTPINLSAAKPNCRMLIWPLWLCFLLSQSRMPVSVLTRKLPHFNGALCEPPPRSQPTVIMILFNYFRDDVTQMQYHFMRPLDVWGGGVWKLTRDSWVGRETYRDSGYRNLWVQLLLYVVIYCNYFLIL